MLSVGIFIGFNFQLKQHKPTSNTYTNTVADHAYFEELKLSNAFLHSPAISWNQFLDYPEFEFWYPSDTKVVDIKNSIKDRNVLAKTEIYIEIFRGDSILTSTSLRKTSDTLENTLNYEKGQYKSENDQITFNEKNVSYQGMNAVELKYKYNSRENITKLLIPYNGDIYVLTANSFGEVSRPDLVMSTFILNK